MDPAPAALRLFVARSLARSVGMYTGPFVFLLDHFGECLTFPGLPQKPGAHAILSSRTFHAAIKIIALIHQDVIFADSSLAYPYRIWL